jgi:GNAT superfamily N-acetyltransferase
LDYGHPTAHASCVLAIPVIINRIKRMLVDKAERIASAEGCTRILLRARILAVGFYEKMGYVRPGDLFTEVGVPHVLMQKDCSVCSIVDPSANSVIRAYGMAA